MEVGIQDRYHTTRTPSFSESRKGKDVVWNFRTTLQIKKHSNKEYTSHKQLGMPSKSGEAEVLKKAGQTSGANFDPQLKGPQP